MIRLCLLTIFSLIYFGSPARAEMDPAAKQQLYKDTAPSLVAVKYTWEHEMGRQELIGAGVVVDEDGLVMIALSVVDPRLPDDQLKEFQIILPQPNEDEVELPATFVGRDERSGVAFVRANEKREWKPLKFIEAPPAVGEKVYSVGVLPKIAGYRAYLMETTIAAHLRGETPQLFVGEGLAGIGSPVFNSKGEAVGVVNAQSDQTSFLNDPRNPMRNLDEPPKFFVPTRFIEISLKDPPKAGETMKLPWIGIPQLTGLTKDVAEFYKLQNQPAIQIGDVIANTPADRAGLKRGQIIVKINGEPLERGDEPEELPGILRRQLVRMKVGDEVKLTILPAPNEEMKEVAMTLEEQPKRPNLAERYYAEDLGFTAREIVFYDTYSRKLEADHGGVIVSFVKPQGAAQNAQLENNDLVLTINGQTAKDVAEFKSLYETFRKDKPREAVVLVVLRGGKEETIRIEPPQ